MLLITRAQLLPTVIFNSIFQCGLLSRAGYITDKLCNKHGTMTLKSAIYNQEPVIMAHILYTKIPPGSPGSAYIHCFSGKAVLATLYISLALGEVDP